MRTILMLGMLAACTGEGRNVALYGDTTCGSSWDTWSAGAYIGKRCDAACTDRDAATDPMDQCSATSESGDYAMCRPSFLYVGVRGCCLPSGQFYQAGSDHSPIPVDDLGDGIYFARCR